MRRALHPRRLPHRHRHRRHPPSFHAEPQEPQTRVCTTFHPIPILPKIPSNSTENRNPRPANHTGADYRSPAAIYAFQALFSLVTLVLYLYATVTLGRHPIITGHPSNGSAKSKYSAGLAFICLGFILSLYEVVAYGIASVYHLRYKAPVEPEANGGDSKAPTIVA